MIKEEIKCLSWPVTIDQCRCTLVLLTLWSLLNQPDHCAIYQVQIVHITWPRFLGSVYMSVPIRGVIPQSNCRPTYDYDYRHLKLVIVN